MPSRYEGSRENQPKVLRWLRAVASKRQVPYQSLINDMLASEMKKVG